MRQTIRHLLFGQTPFSPRNLFAAGEVGAWYEPGSLDTLYQTSTGTTPVTAGEQPVGLVLDKSKGFALGVSVVDNFNSLGTGWTWTGGVLAHAAGSSSRASDTTAVSAGKFYAFTYTVTSSNAGAALSIEAGSNTGVSVNNTVGTHTAYILSAASNASASFFASSALDISITNISVRELPGSHALQSSSTLRPTYKTGPSRLYFDADPDALTITFPSAPGDCTLAYGVSGGEPVITYPVNISGTTYTMNPTNTGANNTGLVIVNRALTAAETVKLTQYLKARS